MSEIRRMSYVECEEEGEAGEDNPLPKLVHRWDTVQLSQNLVRLDIRIGLFG